MGDTVLGALRRPEYTGENRCLPCTVVNLVISAVISTLVAVGVLVRTTWGLGVAAGVGAAVLAVTVAVVYLRGYLVPKTPELTARYLPRRVRSLFGKETAFGIGDVAEPGDDAAGIGTGDSPDPADALLAAGVLERRGADQRPSLAPGFRTDWRRRIRDLREERLDAGTVLDALNVDDVCGGVELAEDDGAMVLHRSDGGIDADLAIWESRAALRADVAAAGLLSEAVDEFPDMPPSERGTVLRDLRFSLDQCPDCDGPTSFGERRTKSCCFATEVAVVDCDRCGTTLTEIPVEPSS